MLRNPPLIVLIALVTQANATPPAKPTDGSTPPPAHGTKNGQAYTGWITKTGEKSAKLQTAEQEDHELADFDQVRFGSDNAKRSYSQLRFPFRISWNRWESVAAMPPVLAGNEVRVTSPFGQHQFPAQALFEISSVRDAEPMWTETFDSLSHWQVQNEVTLSSSKHYSAPSSASLAGTSAALGRPVDPPLQEGRFSFYFYDTGTLHPQSSWSVVLELGDGKEPPQQLELIGGWGERAYKARLPEDLTEATVGVPRSTGWHRWEVEFGESGLAVLLDEASMVSHRRPFKLGPLRQITFRRNSSSPGAAPEPLLCLDDVILAAPPSEIAPISFADPDQAQLRDNNGDQWLGAVRTADDKGVTIRLPGDFDRTFAWDEVRHLRLPAQTNLLKWDGEIGRLVSPAATLWVELKSADRESWTVRHPLLGELSVPTSDVLRYEPRLLGRRQELLSGSYHLGNKVVSEFHRPIADGANCQLNFSWPKPQGEAWVTLYADGLEGTGAMSPYARKIKKGHLATELWLNDQKIETLNNLVALRPAEAVELKIPIPANLLRPGENVLEIRQLADPETGFHDEVEIFQVAIEESDFSSDQLQRKDDRE